MWPTEKSYLASQTNVIGHSARVNMRSLKYAVVLVSEHHYCTIAISKSGCLPRFSTALTLLNTVEMRLF